MLAGNAIGRAIVIFKRGSLMRASPIGQVIRGLTGLLVLTAGSTGALAQDVQAAIQKANAYIEVTKFTERAVESWERYQSWVNMKTGPTGKERYISYGMYDLYDFLAGPLNEARAAAGAEPSVPKLDAVMTRYIDAYEALAPLVNQASAYYDGRGYLTDKAAQGQALHKRMVPLATAFLAERDAMMPELRAFVRDVEQQELAAIEAQEGRSAHWQVGQVMHAADRVIDVFPRERPQVMDSETLDAKIEALGPDSPASAFDEIMAGVVPPQNVVIDVTRFGEALKKYAEAVDVFESFAGEKPEEFDAFKTYPRHLLDLLRAFHGPLIQSQGREFEGGGQMFAQIAHVHTSMFNKGSPIRRTQIRYLP